MTNKLIVNPWIKKFQLKTINIVGNCGKEIPFEILVNKMSNLTRCLMTSHHPWLKATQGISRIPNVIEKWSTQVYQVT